MDPAKGAGTLVKRRCATRSARSNARRRSPPTGSATAPDEHDAVRPWLQDLGLLRCKALAGSLAAFGGGAGDGFAALAVGGLQRGGVWHAQARHTVVIAVGDDDVVVLGQGVSRGVGDGPSVDVDREWLVVGGFEATDVVWAEAEPPDGEEVAERGAEGLVGLHVDHAAGVVRVQGELDVLGVVDTDVLRYGHEQAVVIDVEQLVDVEGFLTGGRKVKRGHALLDARVLGGPGRCGHEHPRPVDHNSGDRLRRPAFAAGGQPDNGQDPGDDEHPVPPKSPDAHGSHVVSIAVWGRSRRLPFEEKFDSGSNWKGSRNGMKS